MTYYTVYMYCLNNQETRFFQQGPGLCSHFAHQSTEEGAAQNLSPLAPYLSLPGCQNSFKKISPTQTGRLKSIEDLHLGRYILRNLQRCLLMNPSQILSPYLFVKSFLCTYQSRTF